MPENTASTEIRTRRLVVVDELDNARIVAEVVRGMAELRVTTADPRTHVLIYAGPTMTEGSDAIGVELFVGDDSVARVHAWSDGDGWSWRIATDE
jgi:hypothetical protein